MNTTRGGERKPRTESSLALAESLLLVALLPATGPTSLKGTIDVVAILSGVPLGGVVGFGTVAPSDVTIIFQATNSPDSDPALGIPSFYIQTSPIAIISGGGYLTGPDEDVDGNLAFPNGLDPGETSDPFFVSFSALAPGDTIEFQIVVLPLGTFTVFAAPEPGSAALLLAALGAAGLLARRCSGGAQRSA